MSKPEFKVDQFDTSYDSLLVVWNEVENAHSYEVKLSGGDIIAEKQEKNITGYYFHYFNHLASETCYKVHLQAESKTEVSEEATTTVCTSELILSVYFCLLET